MLSGRTFKSTGQHHLFGRNWTWLFAFLVRASRSLRSGRFGSTRMQGWSIRSRRRPLFEALALWKIFLIGADLKWHSYEPLPMVGTIEKFLAAVDEDKSSCFWG